ncbi:hypothetical protein VTK56DRAFT_3894 [Thermocarpiscus australiensis]
MKTSVVTAVLAPAVVAHAQWWGGAPECAHECFSSYWSSAANWPAPTSYCNAKPGASVSKCINSACEATPTAITSYSSLSASLCSRWSSCSSAGATGVYTISAPAFTGAWGPGKYGGGGPWHGNNADSDNDNDDDCDEWTRTWTGGVYTVTGCEWNGNPWAGGPGGWGPGGAGVGWGPWAPWGKDWKWSTHTQTITRVVTVTSDGGVTAYSTSVGLATVAEAVSGDVTTTSLVTAQTSPTSGPQGGAAAPAGRDGALGVKVMGALLAGFVAVAGFL